MPGQNRHDIVSFLIHTGHEKMLLERNGLRVVPYPPEESVDLVITSEEKRNVFPAAPLFDSGFLPFLGNGGEGKYLCF